jgi:crotonobetainyl-CoA:carnitine CoA-transferase CaiB-like acyl-CoA transferase
MLGVPAAAAAQSSASADATVSATVVAALTLTKNADLDFGTVGLNTIATVAFTDAAAANWSAAGQANTPVTVIAALTARQVHGRGCHIDAAMYEICAQQMAPAIRAAQRGPAPQRVGNADPTFLEQDVYPARGDDRWVAVSVVDAAQLARLRALTGGVPLADWTRERDDQEIVAELQRQGIAAGVVQDIEDLIENDAALRERGALIDLPHPKLGSFGHVRTPIGFSADVAAPFRAPAIGEHTREIALDVAGINAERYAELEAEGVFK